MSSDSSVSPASSGDETGSETETTVAAALVRPYQNEPVTRGNRNPPPPPSREQKEKMERVGRIDWCLCGSCSPTVDTANLFCCRESAQLEKKRGEETCIIHQRGFSLNALEVEVLDAVYHHFQTRLYRGQKDVDRMRRYRYTAYRNVVAWAWGKLGKGSRTPLPSCVIMKIRNTFPDPDGKYVGYQEAVADH